MRFASVLVALALPATLSAQEPDTLSLTGRSILSASLALTGTREVLVGGSQVGARATDQIGSLSFAHFVRPSVAFEISAALLDADATTAYVNNDASAVSAILFGLSWSPRFLALTKTMRPFVSAAVGAYSHHYSETSGGPNYAKTSTQSHAGGRLSAGVNFFVARHFAMQLLTDYHIAQPFEPVNGTVKDPSGLSLSLGLAFVWGDGGK